MNDSDGAGGPRERGAAPADDDLPPGGLFGLRVLPAGWMRGLLGTVTALVTLVIAMGDLASAWVLLLLPLAVIALVAYAETLERLLGPTNRAAAPTAHRAN
ncbi:hypothetical protein UG55_100630 [Frankia sp. EI5c]|uniref:hypothetical protein n=1 Tax=Frankia sp. EI5c TaxID=683316 RepID=UPI0007C34330|nr:hypothetical protein [Frankia sp. EI5c]OAA28058.1 hypothetical protein UG55_100630 [Frankia sp. EI5c]